MAIHAGSHARCHAATVPVAGGTPRDRDRRMLARGAGAAIAAATLVATLVPVPAVAAQASSTPDASADASPSASGRATTIAKAAGRVLATGSATEYANGLAVSTKANGSCGAAATGAGTVVANKLTVSTRGRRSAAIAAEGGGRISVTNSSLGTAGSGSPLLSSTGTVEASNVTGTASEGQIARLGGSGTILVNGSTLASGQAGKSSGCPVAAGVAIYQTTSDGAEGAADQRASFQAAGSTLKSAIASGAMFYCTNATASIVLCGTRLRFDSSKADLLLAAGNNSDGWGSAGSNGAAVTLTGIGEAMSGNIEADTISQADVYLTRSTTWSGAAAIKRNPTASTSGSPLSVSVDKTSTWVVTANSTVSNLTVAKGGRVIDSSGRTVTIVCDGQTVVEGTSDATVTVNGTYSTHYDPSGADALATPTIDRSQFDRAYGTSTSFSMSASAPKARSSASGDPAGADASGSSPASGPSADAATFQQFLAAIASFFQGLLGLG